MSGSSKKRISKEFEEINKNKLDGMDVSLVDDDLLQWQVFMDGPAKTPYAGGRFKVLITLPNEYPFKAPTINFETRIYHPNVSNDKMGGMCLGLVKPDVWKPSSKLASVLTAIKQLLIEPLPDDAVEASIADLYKNNRKEYETKATEFTKKHAMKKEEKKEKK